MTGLSVPQTQVSVSSNLLAFDIPKQINDNTAALAPQPSFVIDVTTTLEEIRNSNAHIQNVIATDSTELADNTWLTHYRENLLSFIGFTTVNAAKTHYYNNPQHRKMIDSSMAMLNKIAKIDNIMNVVEDYDHLLFAARELADLQTSLFYSPGDKQAEKALLDQFIITQTQYEALNKKIAQADSSQRPISSRGTRASKRAYVPGYKDASNRLTQDRQTLTSLQNRKNTLSEAINIDIISYIQGEVAGEKAQYEDAIEAAVDSGCITGEEAYTLTHALRHEVPLTPEQREMIEQKRDVVNGALQTVQVSLDVANSKLNDNREGAQAHLNNAKESAGGSVFHKHYDVAEREITLAKSQLNAAENCLNNQDNSTCHAGKDDDIDSAEKQLDRITAETPSGPYATYQATLASLISAVKQSYQNRAAALCNQMDAEQIPDHTSAANKPGLLVDGGNATTEALMGSLSKLMQQGNQSPTKPEGESENTNSLPINMPAA